MRLIPGCLALLGLVGAFGPASSARALTISPNPFTVSDSGAAGSLELVAVVSGVPTGGSVLLGSVDPGDTTLVIRADVTAGTSSALFLGIQPIASPGSWIPLAGAGWIPGSGADIAFAGSNVAGTAGFGASGGVASGGSYDLVFLSYDAPPAQDGSLELAAGILLVPNSLGTATIVPEPATPLLLGIGLALLGGGRARRA